MDYTESVFKGLILLSHKTFHVQKTLKTVFQNANKVCVTMCRPPLECHVLFEWPLTRLHFIKLLSQNDLAY
jgi:hypothetical protein